MIHIFKELFAEHYLALVALAVSWIGVYFAFRLLDAVASKLLLRLPFFIWIRVRRRLIGSVAAYDRLRRNVDVVNIEADRLASLVGELYGTVDKEFSKIRNGERAISLLLREHSIRKELRRIAETDWALLESDFALCEALSADPEKSTRGIISFIGNPHSSPSDTADLLLYTLRRWPGFELTENVVAPLNTALFHVGKVIQTAKQLNELEGIVSHLPEAQKQKGCEVTHEVHDRLSKKGLVKAAGAGGN